MTVVLIVWMACLGVGWAQSVRYVDTAAMGSHDGTSWPNAYTNLAEALAATGGGTNLWVAAGTYAHGVPFPMKSGLGLYGGFTVGMSQLSERDWDDYPTLLDGQGARTVISGANNAILDGFVITNGAAAAGAGMVNNDVAPTVRHCVFANNAAGATGGGAVYNNGEAADAVFIACTFRDNTASGYGGAVLNYSADPVFTDCTFTQNRSTGSVGGSMASEGTYSLLETITLTGCTFTSNRAAGAGGAIHSPNANTLAISNCVFTANRSDQDGGALYVNNNTLAIRDSRFVGNVANSAGVLYNYSTSKGMLQGCVFVGNQATNGTGGAYYSYGGTGSLTNRDCTFAGNSAWSSSPGLFGGSGGALSCMGDNSVYEGCVFSANRAAGAGGVFGRGYWDGDPAWVLRRCTVVGNESGATGGGVYYGVGPAGGGPRFENSVLAGNVSAVGGGVVAFPSESASGFQALHCTFSGNRATTSGGAALIGSATAYLTNNIFWGNAAATGAEIHQQIANRAIVGYSDVQGGWAGLGGNNISADPLFVGAVVTGAWAAVGAYDAGLGQTALRDAAAPWYVNEYAGLTVNPSTNQWLQFAIASNTVDTLYVWGDATRNRTNGVVAAAGGCYRLHDYRLGAGSPCLELGLNLAVGSDLAGTVRPQPAGGTSDMGAYEFAVDAEAPEAVSGLTATPSANTIRFLWANPTNRDMQGVLVLRRAGEAPAGMPTDGVRYTTNDMIGGDAVVFVGRGSRWYDTGVVNGTAYHYAFFAFDEVPNYSVGAGISAMPIADGAAPGAVSGLAAQGGVRQIALSWTHPPEADFEAVLIARRVGSTPTGAPQAGRAYAIGEAVGDGEVVYTGWGSDFAPGAATGWTDAGLQRGAPYGYRVFARDLILNYSAGADAFATTDSEGAATPVIENDAATNLLSESIYLNGTLFSTGASPTEVWAFWGGADGGTDTGRWEHAIGFGVMQPGTISLKLTGLTADREYGYRFQATNVAGAAWAPRTEPFLTAFDAAAAPAGLVARVRGADRIDLAWTDRARTESGFAVERSFDLTNWVGVGQTGRDVASFSHTGLTANTWYHYRVQATNGVHASAYTAVASGRTLGALSVADNFAWDAQAADDNWSSGANWLPNATAGNPDYRDEVAFENTATAALGTDTSVVDTDVLVKRLFVANTTAAHTLNIPAGLSLVVDDTTRIGGGVSRSALAVGGGGRFESAQVAVAQGAANAHGTLAILAGGTVLVSGTLTVAENSGGANVFATGVVSVAAGGALQVGAAGALGRVVLGDCLTTGNTRGAGATVQAEAESVVDLALDELRIARNQGSGSGNGVTATLEAMPATVTIAVERLSMGTNSHNTGTLRFGGVASTVRAANVALGNGLVEIGARGLLAVSNRLEIGRGRGENGFVATGRVALTEGSRLEVGRPEAPGELIVGEQLTAGTGLSHTGLLVTASGSMDSFYLTRMIIGVNNSGGGTGNGAGGVVDLNAGRNVVSAGSVELGFSTNVAWGYLSCGGVDPLSVAAGQVVVGHGALTLGPSGTLTVSNALAIGQGLRNAVTGLLSMAAGSVLHVGAPGARGTLAVGRQLAAGNTKQTLGSWSPAAGSRVDLWLSDLAVGENLGTGSDNSATGRLDFTALTLVTNAPAAGEARFDAGALRVGVGVGAADGQLRLGAGAVDVGALTVGGGATQRGVLDLQETLMRVSGACVVKTGGVVVARVADRSAGLRCAAGTPAVHSLTNIQLVFTAQPAQDLRELWGLAVSGEQTAWLRSLTNAGAISLSRAGLDERYAFDVFHRPVENRTYVGVDLALRVLNEPAVGTTLAGRVYATGGAENPQVYICWGDDDAGATSTSAWDRVEALGAGWGIGERFTAAVSGVTADRLHFYRCYVRNGTGEDWADDAVAFTTGAVTLQASDAQATETPGDPGAFVVTRPAALTNGALIVNYTIGGSASNGADYAWLPGYVEIPDGQAAGVIPVTPHDDALWNEGDESVTLTLAAGGYVIGVPDHDTVLIRDDENPADWAHHMTVTFDGYTRSEELTNFPVLVVLHEGIPGFRYADFASGAGGDPALGWASLRFTDAAGAMARDFEIERWDPAGRSYVWVRVPNLAAGSSVRAWWGNPAMTVPPAAAAGGVWTNGYAGVWHLKEGGIADGAPRFADSTVHTNAGRDYVSAAGREGVIDGGQEFDGTDDWIGVPHGTSLALTTSVTVAVWLRPDVTKSYYERIVEKDWDTSWALAYGDPDNSLVVALNGAARVATAAGVVRVGRWNHVVFTYDKDAGGTDEVKLYVDGQRVASGDYSAAMGADTDDINIGRWDDGAGSLFDGSLDEVRVAAVARSSNWVWACWLNQSAPEAFVSVGPVWPYPLVRTEAASGIGFDAATANGELVSTGASPTAVRLFWGTNDGGTVAGAWGTNVFLGLPSTGAVSRALTGLADETAYYYRLHASNAQGAVWAATSTVFRSGLDASRFAHRMQVPVWTYAPAETLTNFPLLVRLGEEESFFRYAQFAAPGGEDLRFADAGGINPLNFEVENWDPFGASYVWVQVPAAAPRTYVWAYWGNTNAITRPPQALDGAAWSEGYAGVWHLGEPVTDGASGGTNHVDATANRNHAVQNGNNDQPAVVDRGQEIAGADYLRAPDAASLDLGGAVTLSAWVKLVTYPTANSLVAAKGDAGSALNYGLWVVNNHTLLLRYLNGTGQDLYSTAAFSLDAWHHVAGVIDPARGYRAIYVDGVRRAESMAVLPPLAPNAFDFYVGGREGTWQANGIFDEVRVESAARSSNWVWAAWANQREPSVFAPIGVGWPRPALINAGPTSITARAAVAQADLLSTGAAPTRVWMYWGDEDGGTNKTGWDANVPLDWQPEGPLSVTIGGLADVSNYYYRGYASNAFGDVWAPDTRSFTTPLDLVAIGGTNYIGENMDFEDAGTPRAGYPYIVWDWDNHNYVDVGKDGALRPMRGNLMMEAHTTTRPWESNYAVHFDVFNRHDSPYLDFTRYREAITNGTARFTFTFHYNRVSSAFDPQVDTAVFGLVTFYSATGVDLGSQGWPRDANFASDDDPSSWEAATVTGVLPPAAVRVRIWLGWYENVNNEQAAGQEFRGNYFDNIQFGLIFPILALPEPTGVLLLVK